MNPWEIRRLGELTTKIGSGATPRGGKAVYQDEGTSFIRSQNVYDLRFDHEGLVRISDQAADALSGVTVNRADVLINITGESVTRTCLVDNKALPARVSQHVAIIRAEQRRLHPQYLLYALVNPPTKARLNALSQAGATRRALTKGHLEALEIAVPPLEEQERIADVLGAFDDLIETSRRLALRMEDAARTMTKRITTTVPLHVIAATPHLRQRKPEGTVDHFSIPAFDSSLLPSLESGATILSGKQILEVDSVLVSRLNPKTERTWMAYTRSSAPAVCSPEFVVLQGSEGIPSEMIWTLASTRSFWEQMRGAVSGTTNSRQRVDKAAIPNFEVPDPRELDATARHAVASLVRGAVELRIEAAHLTRQRDQLLPLLISGRVRVRDLEATS